MDNDELLAALRKTFPVVDRWRLVLGEGVIPTAGSELATDDEAWMYFPSTTLALVGLGAAREHLHAVELLVGAKELFPSAVATLCRPALIGAAQTVWMLAPDDRVERARRSLSLVYEDYDRHIQFGKDALTMLQPQNLRPSGAEDLERVALRRSQVKALLAGVGGRVSINLSDVIIPAALERAIPDAGQRAQMALRWRTMSAASHALVWHHFGNEGTSHSELDAAGIGHIEVKGDIGTLIMDYFTAYHVATTGWELLAARSGRPELVVDAE